MNSRPRLAPDEPVFSQEGEHTRPAAPARLPVELHAYTAEGYAVTIRLELAAGAIAEAAQRLQALGLSPTPPTRPETPQRGAGRVTGHKSKQPPIYNDQGAPCCPIHERPLKEGQWGLYCSAKDDSTERGYCAYTWKE